VVATIHVGDCLETLLGMADASVHSIVTDPPYGISFMGKGWDSDVPPVAVWAEYLRVLKPGAEWCGHRLPPCPIHRPVLAG
jgi:site-specific DNA-methyltransferase (adenine-specific)